ncbi:MAG TPA: prepilin-type N-terminal cleavage/methylation domain-containing protein [bacterium]|nr:prepilin-type N-terminal cleavage/methylation domain-containing protein [bacterium]
MVRGERGFTLIELMIVVVIIGVLVSIGLPQYNNMTSQARVAAVKNNMHTLQIAVEDFASRSNGVYPPNAATLTVDGALTLQQLLPSAAMPTNPFTAGPTTLDWSNALGTPPATDPAGGVSLNVIQSIPGAAWDTYEIRGADGANALLSTILSNT